MKSNKVLSILLALVGIVAIILSIVCFTADSGSFESYERYGGDAYTGIQNASAHTSNNVMHLGDIVKTGFGSVLLVAGLSLAGVGVCGLIGEKKEVLPSPAEAASPVVSDNPLQAEAVTAVDPNPDTSESENDEK